MTLYECQYVFLLGKLTPFPIAPVRETLKSNGYEMLKYTDDSEGMFRIYFTGTKESCLEIREDVSRVLKLIETGYSNKLYKWFEYRAPGGKWKGHPRYNK